MADSEGDPSFQEVLARLTSDTVRNDLIFDDVVHAVDRGKRPLLLTDRISDDFALLKRFHILGLLFQVGTPALKNHGAQVRQDDPSG